MRMRHEDMGDGFSAHRIEQGRDMRLVERTGIDDRDVAAADDIGQGPLEREWTRIIGEQPPHAGCDLLHGIGRKVETLIEGNVVAHAYRPWEETGLLPMLSRTSGSRARGQQSVDQPSLRPMMSSQRASPAGPLSNSRSPK